MFIRRGHTNTFVHLVCLGDLFNGQFIASIYVKLTCMTYTVKNDIVIMVRKA